MILRLFHGNYSIKCRYDEFDDLGAETIGISLESVYTHLLWIKTSQEENRQGNIHFPLASNKNMQVSKSYGVFIEDGGLAL